MTRETFDSFATMQAEQAAEHYIKYGRFINESDAAKVCKTLLRYLVKQGWRKPTEGMGE